MILKTAAEFKDQHHCPRCPVEREECICRETIKLLSLPIQLIFHLAVKNNWGHNHALFTHAHHLVNHECQAKERVFLQSYGGLSPLR